MPEPLKNLYNKALVTDLAAKIAQHYPAFDSTAFQRSVFVKGWKDKELKQRMRHITKCLYRDLPPDYPAALEIL